MLVKDTCRICLFQGRVKDQNMFKPFVHNTLLQKGRGFVIIYSLTLIAETQNAYTYFVS